MEFLVLRARLLKSSSLIDYVTAKANGYHNHTLKAAVKALTITTFSASLIGGALIPNAFAQDAAQFNAANTLAMSAPAQAAVQAAASESGQATAQAPATKSIVKPANQLLRPVPAQADESTLKAAQATAAKAKPRTTIKVDKLAGSMQGVKLKVLVDIKNAPFAALVKDLKHPQGYDVELLYDLKKRLGFDLVENRFFPVDSERGYQMLRNGEADVFIGGLTLNEDRSKELDTTKVVYSSGLSILLSKKNTEIFGMGDLKGKKVAVKPHSPAEEYLTSVANVKPITYTNFINAYSDLAHGYIDAVVADRPSLVYFANTVPVFNLKVTDDVFDIHSGQFAFYLKKNSPYTQSFNIMLMRMDADGTTYRLRKSWGLD